MQARVAQKPGRSRVPDRQQAVGAALEAAHTELKAFRRLAEKEIYTDEING